MNTHTRSFSHIHSLTCTQNVLFYQMVVVDTCHNLNITTSHPPPHTSYITHQPIFSSLLSPSVTSVTYTCFC